MSHKTVIVFSLIALLFATVLPTPTTSQVYYREVKVTLPKEVTGILHFKADLRYELKNDILRPDFSNIRVVVNGEETGYWLKSVVDYKTLYVMSGSRIGTEVRVWAKVNNNLYGCNCWRGQTVPSYIYRYDLSSGNIYVLKYMNETLPGGFYLDSSGSRIWFAGSTYLPSISSYCLMVGYIDYVNNVVDTVIDTGHCGLIYHPVGMTLWDNYVVLGTQRATSLIIFIPVNTWNDPLTWEVVSAPKANTTVFPFTYGGKLYVALWGFWSGTLPPYNLTIYLYEGNSTFTKVYERYDLITVQYLSPSLPVINGRFYIAYAFSNDTKIYLDVVNSSTWAIIDTIRTSIPSYSRAVMLSVVGVGTRYLVIGQGSSSAIYVYDVVSKKSFMVQEMTPYYRIETWGPGPPSGASTLYNVRLQLSQFAKDDADLSFYGCMLYNYTGHCGAWTIGIVDIWLRHYFKKNNTIILYFSQPATTSSPSSVFDYVWDTITPLDWNITGNISYFHGYTVFAEESNTWMPHALKTFSKSIVTVLVRVGVNETPTCGAGTRIWNDSVTVGSLWAISPVQGIKVNGVPIWYYVVELGVTFNGTHYISWFNSTLENGGFKASRSSKTNLTVELGNTVTVATTCDWADVYVDYVYVANVPLINMIMPVDVVVGPPMEQVTVTLSSLPPPPSVTIGLPRLFVERPGLYSPQGLFLLALFLGVFVIYMRRLDWVDALVTASSICLVLSVLLFGPSAIVLFLVLLIVGLTLRLRAR